MAVRTDFHDADDPYSHVDAADLANVARNIICELNDPTSILKRIRGICAARFTTDSSDQSWQELIDLIDRYLASDTPRQTDRARSELSLFADRSQKKER